MLNSELDTPSKKTIIMVVGIGGGGSNAVQYAYQNGDIAGVSFTVVNTDLQVLDQSPVPNRLQIGPKLTNGNGAGADPLKGEKAAKESKEEIRKLFEDGVKMVFIIAGMGGGTGTGAAPVIAQVAKELGILTVGVVTRPFQFEGPKKMHKANVGIERLKNYCDTVLVILNEKLRETHPDLGMTNAFSLVNEEITMGVKSIAEIITIPHTINVDYEDVKTVLKNSGGALMGSGKAEGDQRAISALEKALKSPFLTDQDIHGATKVLLSVISDPDHEIKMDELALIVDRIQERVGNSAEVIFGHRCQSGLGQKVRVTVIVTGFKEKDMEVHTKLATPTTPAEPTIPKPNPPQEQDTQVYRERPIRSPQPLNGYPSANHFNHSKSGDSMYRLDSIMEEKERIFREKAESLTNSLKIGEIPNPLTEEEIRDYKTPAYLRKNVSLSYYPANKKLIRHELER